MRNIILSNDNKIKNYSDLFIHQATLEIPKFLERDLCTVKEFDRDPAAYSATPDKSKIRKCMTVDRQEQS